MTRRVLALWLPAAFASTVLALAGYGLVQHSLRSGANDPQAALAQDARFALDAGTPAAAVVPEQTVDIHRSLAPWVAVYDGSRKLVASSADGLDAFPTSVFDSVPAGGRDVVTWQPDTSTRQAAVVERWAHGWVVAGRSLALVEQREDQTLQLSVLAWLGALVAAAAGAVAGAMVTRPVS